MNREIKRLLKLSRIPNFVLSKEEQAYLDEWKAAQEPVKVKAPKKTSTRKKKTTNEVKNKEKFVKCNKLCVKVFPGSSGEIVCRACKRRFRFYVDSQAKSILSVKARPIEPQTDIIKEEN